MALTQLSNVQKAVLVALVEARRLDAVPADESRASSFMQQAERSSSTASGGRATRTDTKPSPWEPRRQTGPSRSRGSSSMPPSCEA